MLSNKEFVYWLRGFIAASSKHNLSTEGWDILKHKLEEVYDDSVLEMLKDPNTFRVPDYPLPTQPYPGIHPTYPTDPLKWYNPNGNPVFPPYFVGDQPGWLSSPWRVTSTLTGATFTPPKQTSNEQ